MRSRWNINTIMCKYCNDDITDIKGIFDGINIKEEAPTFYIVTFINGINVGEPVELIYCIDEVRGKRRAYLGKIKMMQKKKLACFKDGTEKVGTMNNCSIDAVCRKIEKADFPSEGAYELKVFGYIGENEIKKIDLLNDEDILSKLEDEKLMSTYPFRVNYSK